MIGSARAKNHHLQINANLGGRQTRTMDRLHGFKHVTHQQMQLVGIKTLHGLSDAQQARIAHFQNGVDGHEAGPENCCSSPHSQES